MDIRKLPLIIALFFVVLSTPLNETTAAGRPLTIGTKETVPFSFKDKQGNWNGISIELWQQIANDLNLEFNLKEMKLNEILDGVKNGSLDAGVAAFTITSEREEFLDFSHPYFMTGLSIAVSHENTGFLLTYVKRIFSMDLLKVIFLLALLLLIVGFIVWLFERRRNPEQFGGSKIKGIGAGFWWSAVTMTTVGYGDKAPSTTGGRIIGFVWMFAGIIMISSFTAAITSELTVSQLETSVKGPEDLPSVRVGTVMGSTSEKYLDEQNIYFQTFNTINKALEAIESGYVDAIVYDDPILRYLANTDFKGKVQVIPNIFEKQYYGIVVQQNSPYRESINKILLHFINEPEWKKVLFNYLGN